MRSREGADFSGQEWTRSDRHVAIVDVSQCESFEETRARKRSHASSLAWRALPSTLLRLTQKRRRMGCAFSGSDTEHSRRYTTFKDATESGDGHESTASRPPVGDTEPAEVIESARVGEIASPTKSTRGSKKKAAGYWVPAGSDTGLLRLQSSPPQQRSGPATAAPRRSSLLLQSWSDGFVDPDSRPASPGSRRHSRAGSPGPAQLPGAVPPGIPLVLS